MPRNRFPYRWDGPCGAMLLWLMAAWLLVPSPVLGQDVIRLPPVDHNPAGYENPPLLYEPILPATYPGDLSQPFLDDYPTDLLPGEALLDEYDSGVAPQMFSNVARSKDGFFQKLFLSETYIPRFGDEGLGMHDAEIALSVALPLPTRRWPVVITPGFATHFLDGPSHIDLPPRLYDAYVAFTWYPRFTPNWGAIVRVAPSVFSDFEKWDEQAFRLPSQFLLRYTWAEYERELVLGAIYLDRDDITWLPAAGLIWTPNPYLAYELIFPRPRVLLMLNEQPDFEDWLYVAGELGGGSWAVQRVPGFAQDVVTLSDYRVLVGWERRAQGGAGFRLEAGYVFARTIEYSSTGDAQFDLEDSLLVRGTVSF